MAVESHDKKLSELLTWVGHGKAQLPEFPRSWVWDDSKICKLIESITSGFPMGAAMFLEGHGDSVRFIGQMGALVTMDVDCRMMPDKRFIAMSLVSSSEMADSGGGELSYS